MSTRLDFTTLWVIMRVGIKSSPIRPDRKAGWRDGEGREIQ